MQLALRWQGKLNQLFPLLLAVFAPLCLADPDNTLYVGSETCVECHAEQYKLWQESDHYAAMQVANARTVLGDFNNAQFQYDGVHSRFYHRNGKYYVDTDNANGDIQSFAISYTFGLHPLQQYLIAFPDGRYQALNIAWDTRSPDQGGQRWFHLYPGEKIDFRDSLHWTGVYHNWNSRCASCHSTNLQKNYQQTTNSYNTTWSELNVGCEACHGPAGTHLQWANQQPPPDTAPAYKGFNYSLADSGQWQTVSGNNTAQRQTNLRSKNQIDTCAHCHALRVELSDPPFSSDFFAAHQSQFIVDGLYYPDGQIREEVYVYDAFLQSKMHAKGVVCSNCHDAHSGRLKAQGNAVCLQCHQTNVFNTEQHHHHQTGSKGAQCANCHMPESTYMVVDPRRDHSIRIPSPDLSSKLGTPNACNQCHQDQTVDWVINACQLWYDKEGYGKKDSSRSPRAGFAEALALAWLGDASSVPDLARLAADPSQSSIVRASALQQLANFPDPRTIKTARDALQSDDPALRIAALRALQILPVRQRQVLLPLVNDPVKAVRMELAPMLAALPAQKIPAGLLPRLQDVFVEYIAAQRHNADMPGAQLNLGIFYVTQRDLSAAEQAYQQALKLAPQFIPALLNLADLYRSQEQDDNARPLLLKAINIAPDQAAAHHALGLLEVRQQHIETAIDHLCRAAELAPTMTRYSYVYAVALDSADRLPEAITTLEQALQSNPDDYQLLSGLRYYYDKAGNTSGAEKLRAKIQQMYPQSK